LSSYYTRKFIIDNIANSDYMLQVSFIGYDKVYRTVKLPADLHYCQKDWQ